MLRYEEKSRDEEVMMTRGDGQFPLDIPPRNARGLELVKTRAQLERLEAVGRLEFVSFESDKVHMLAIPSPLTSQPLIP